MKDLEFESNLELCPVCGGTGNNPNNEKYKCARCDGCRIINHFSISYDIIVPYRNEEDRANNERAILHYIGATKKSLGVIKENK